MAWSTSTSAQQKHFIYEKMHLCHDGENEIDIIITIAFSSTSINQTKTKEKRENEASKANAMLRRRSVQRWCGECEPSECHEAAKKRSPFDSALIFWWELRFIIIKCCQFLVAQQPRIIHSVEL